MTSQCLNWLFWASIPVQCNMFFKAITPGGFLFPSHASTSIQLVKPPWAKTRKIWSQGCTWGCTWGCSQGWSQGCSQGCTQVGTKVCPQVCPQGHPQNSYTSCPTAGPSKGESWQQPHTASLTNQVSLSRSPFVKKSKTAAQTGTMHLTCLWQVLQSTHPKSMAANTSPKWKISRFFLLK